MFTNPSNNIGDQRLVALLPLFANDAAIKKNHAIGSTAMDAMKAFKETTAGQSSGLFDAETALDKKCLGNFASINSSVKIALKQRGNDKIVGGMLKSISDKALPQLDQDLKLLKTTDTDPVRQGAYDKAIDFINQVKVACKLDTNDNTPAPK